MTLEGSKTWLRRGLEKRDRDAAVAKPETEQQADSGPTIQQILNDPQDSESLGQMIDSKKDKALNELAQRLLEGNTNENDITELQKVRAEFLEKKSRAESLVASVEGRFADLRASSSTLDVACTTLGSENYLSVLKQGLSELVMSDPKAFETIEKQYAAQEKSEKQLDDPENPANKKIADFVTKYRLSEDRFDALMAESDPVKRIEKIREVIHGEMYFWQRWIDESKAGKGKVSSVDWAKDIADEVQRQEKVLNRHTKLIEKSGNVLVALVSKRPELRNALLNARPGEEPKITGGISSKTSFAEAREQNRNPEAVKEAWEIYKESRGIRDFDRKAPSVRQSTQDQFLNRYAHEQAARKTGFWAAIFELIFGNWIKTDPRVRAQLA